MITAGARWMRFLRAWVSGTKHPDTPFKVYKNIWEYDRLRRILKGRCAFCNYVLSEDAAAVREVAHKCSNATCQCRKIGGSSIHAICDLCYWVYRSLYTNPTLKNYDYFKQIDEQEENQNRNGRNRMGL